MELSKFIVEDTVSVHDAVSLMNQNARQIVFVCRENKLVAALADGDIRRFILDNGDISEPISKVANYDVKYLPYTQQAYAQDFMRRQGIRAVPIVNADRQIISIKFSSFDDVRKSVSLGIPVVIMAGGKGTRLAPYTNILPKPLIPIGEKTITEHIMERFAQFGCHEFHVIVNYKKELIKAYFADINAGHSVKFYEEQGFLGTGGGLRLLEGMVDTTFFMTNSDILIDANYEDILHSHKQGNALITIICAKKTIVFPYGAVQLDSMGAPISFMEKPEFSMLTNTGFYVIEPGFLAHIPEGEVPITDVIQKLMETGSVGIYTVSDDAWLDMGEFEQLDRMRENLCAFDERRT